MCVYRHRFTFKDIFFITDGNRKCIRSRFYKKLFLNENKNKIGEDLVDSTLALMDVVIH